jgi:hypothetical protein
MPSVLLLTQDHEYGSALHDALVVMRTMKSLGLLALRYLPSHCQKHHNEHRKAWWCRAERAHAMWSTTSSNCRRLHHKRHSRHTCFSSSITRWSALQSWRSSDGPSIIASQPKESSHLGHRHRRLPIQDLSHLAEVHRDSFRWYHVAQEWYFLDLELTLAKLGIKLVVS